MLVLCREFGGSPSQRLGLGDPYLAYQLDAAMSMRALELRSKPQDPHEEAIANRERVAANVKRMGLR